MPDPDGRVVLAKKWNTAWQYPALGILAVVGALAAGAGAVAYIAMDYIDSFDEGITIYQINLITCSFVVVLPGLEATLKRSERRLRVVQAIVVAVLAITYLVALARWPAAATLVYEDDPHPIATFLVYILTALGVPSLCYVIGGSAARAIDRELALRAS